MTPSDDDINWGHRRGNPYDLPWQPSFTSGCGIEPAAKGKKVCKEEEPEPCTENSCDMEKGADDKDPTSPFEESIVGKVTLRVRSSQAIETTKPAKGGDAS